jgi:hypothetical protein
MAGETIKHVFISHVHEDDEGLGKLKDLLAKNGMQIKDASIDASSPNEAKSPEYIKSQILAPQIQWASTLIVYISPKTKDSEWVNWEIEYALSLGKKIIGVWEHGAGECDIPEALDNYADAVLVGWHGQNIIDAINGDGKEWEKPDGAPAEPRHIKRHPC